MISHLSLNFQRRRLPWLWSGSHISGLAQLICVFLVVRVIEATDVLKIVSSILRSYGRKPSSLKGSHPMIPTSLSVSVIAQKSLASTAALVFALIS